MAGKAMARGLRTATVSPTTSYYVERDGLIYAGTHLLLDFWDARNLDNPSAIRDSITQAVRACGATLINLEVRRFKSGGVSGVAILAESHMSIHTWPETGYAAADIFMCGSCDAYKALPILCELFRAGRYNVVEHKRGLSL